MLNIIFSVCRKRWLIGILMLLPALLAVPYPAAAHGYLVRLIPADRAVLERAPTRIQAWFSERLEPRFSSFDLSNERGERIPLTENGVVMTNPTQLSARIPVALPDGLYLVTMRVAFASDGHVFNERMAFWVGRASKEAEIGATARTADPLETLWRMITLPALEVLFGLFLLYPAVLLPGWGNAAYRAGRLTPRVLARLNLVAWVAILAALGGTLLALLQQSAILFNTDIGTVLRDNLWSGILNGTQIGDTLKLRFVFIGLAGAILFGARYAADRLPILVAPLLAFNAIPVALALGTISASSHAAGADLWPLPSMLVHWLHVLAIGAWIGGLVTLSAVIGVALVPLPETEQRAALLAVMRRFSAVGAVALGLVVTTGLYNAGIQVRQPADMWTTPYGLVLVAKLALVVPLAGIALYHHALVSQDWLARLLARFAAQLRPRGRTLAAEAVMGIVVLFAAAVLAATPPPVPPEISAELPTQTVQVGSLAVTLLLDPGGAGDNAYQVTLAQNGLPLAGAEVWARFVLPTLDKRSKPLRLDDAGDGTYLNAGPELERAGNWQVLVDILASGKETAMRAAFEVALPEAAPALYVRSPSALNWLSVAFILAAFTFWLAPVTARRMRALDLNPTSVLIGALLFVVTIVALAAGAFILDNAERRSDALRNPLPAVVNPEVAGEKSIAAGRILYETHCAACHGPTGQGNGPQAAQFRQMPILSYVLRGRRDEDLYRVLTVGAMQMPAPKLSESERWDVINYLRSPVFFEPSGKSN